MPAIPKPQARPTTLLPVEVGAVAVVAKFFRALGDPARLRLLEYLLHDEHTVTECVAQVGLSQGRVSAHLACLADCGYVQVRREGRFAHYTVADPRVADLVVLARSLATDNTTALASCARIDDQRHLGPLTVRSPARHPIPPDGCQSMLGEV